MITFYQDVPKQRGAMEEFLREHQRYFTMSSWNERTSYSNRVKIPDLGLTPEQRDTAYELLTCDDPSVWNDINDQIKEFEKEHGYTAVFNGRGNGYMVLVNKWGCFAGIDEGRYFDDWDDDELLERVKLVQAFDKLCDDCVETFAYYCDHYKVMEQEIMVPKKINVLEKK